MGCLVTRYYLQELDGYTQCLAFHAISGPHRGSLLAHLFYGQGAADLRPGSDFLKRREKSEKRLAGIKLYSCRTPFDHMLIPSKSTHWDIAQNYISKALIHRFILKDKLVLCVIKNLLCNKKI